MTPQEFYDMGTQHGGPTGVKIVDPTLTDEKSGKTKPNPTPEYLYTFTDGTHLTAKVEADNSVSITDWGNAGPKAASASAAPKTPTGQLDQVTDPRTGAVIGLRDPISGQVISLPAQGSAAGATPIAANTTAPYILTRQADGTITQEVNANYVPPTPPAAPQGPAPKPAAGATRLSTQAANGQVYTIQEISDGMGGWSVDPSYKAQVAIAKPAPADLVPVLDPTTGKAIAMRDPVTGTTVMLPAPLDPNDAAYKQAQTDYQNSMTAKNLQSMQPVGQKAIQDMYDSIGAVQGMMEQGTMTPAEGSAYMDALKTNLNATLQGTTPWQMKTDQQTEERNRADLGRQLLDQRLTSGTSMSNSLMGLLGSVGGKLADIGHPINFDPFAMGQKAASDMGGGQQVSDLAKTLLGTLQPGAQAGTQPAAVPAPAPAPAALGANPTLNDLLINMLASQPNLAAQGRPTQVTPTVTQVTPTITLPANPYGGDQAAKAAFEAQYPANQGYDPLAIWRQQAAANMRR